MRRLLAASISVIFLAFVPAAVYAGGSTLYLSPSFMTPSIGDTLQVQVMADTAGVPINAAEAELSFDPASLAVDHISTDGSLLDSWPTQPIFSNTDGTVRFTGWAKAPYVGDKGLLLTIFFKALRNGTATVHFTGGSLLADADESNTIADMRAGAYSVEPHELPVVVPTSTQPELTPATTSISDAAPRQTSAATEAPVSPPTFTTYASVVAVGEPVIVKGEAPAGAKVYVWMQHEQDPVAVDTIAAADDGSFTFASAAPVADGAYRIWALAEDNTGRQSALSDTITITARPTNAAAVVLSLARNSWPFITLVLLAALAVAYLFVRFRKEGSYEI